MVSELFCNVSILCSVVLLSSPKKISFQNFKIVSSVHAADNCNIAEELKEIQKFVIVLDSLTRIPEEIFNLLSSSWSILECLVMSIRENAVFMG